MCCRDICVHRPRRMRWVLSGPVWGCGQDRAEQPLGWKGSWAWPLSSVPAGRDVPALQGTAGRLLLEERCTKGPRHGAAASHPLQQARLWGGGAGEVRRRLNPLLHRINPCPEFLWLCQPPERKPHCCFPGEGEGGLSGSQPAGHSLGLPKASLCQLCQRSPPAHSEPCLVQGCQQLHSRFRAALPPTHQHNDPDRSWLEHRATSCREMQGHRVHLRS